MSPVLLSTINTKLSVSGIQWDLSLDLSHKLLPLSERMLSLSLLLALACHFQTEWSIPFLLYNPIILCTAPYSTALSFNIWWVCHLFQLMTPTRAVITGTSFTAVSSAPHTLPDIQKSLKYLLIIYILSTFHYIHYINIKQKYCQAFKWPEYLKKKHHLKAVTYAINSYKQITN